MGIHERPYFREESTFSAGYARPTSGIMFGMPKPGRAVKILLIINLVVFVLQLFLDKRTDDRLGLMSTWLGATAGEWLQVWRYITFQFLHSGFMHIGLNMLGLYMLGTPLERYMGTRRFVWFYLSCGVVAGVAYAAMGLALNLDKSVPIIGASGGVFAILLACAVRFPQFKLIFFLFPLPIRFAAVIIFGGMILIILSSLGGGSVGNDFFSQVAHLGGTVGAAFWIWGMPKLMGLSVDVRQKLNNGAWQRKVRRQTEEEKTIDEILRKVHENGINSLTRKEKNTLADATKRQRHQGD